MRSRIKFRKAQINPEKHILVLESLRTTTLVVAHIRKQEDNMFVLTDRQGLEMFKDLDVQKVLQTAKVCFEDHDATHNPSVKGKQGFRNDYRLFSY